MDEITLQEVLDARETRADSQRRLLASWGRPLLGLNMNIAGPVKRWPLVDFAFWEGLRALRERLGPSVLREELTDSPTGLEAILVCEKPAEELKVLAMELETARPAGRLYDLDVIGTDNCKLSRGTQRTCLVCGGPVGPCARSRAHGLDAIRAATDALLRDFAVERLGELAVEALIREVDLSPKPGLVDRRNSGAHRDMDRALFHVSAKCLEPYFRRAVELGLDRQACMPDLQRAGLEAEGTMLEATGGVNTHKGAIYAFGIILAGLGSVLARGGDLFEAAAALAAAGLPPAAGTHGGEAKRLYGVLGARGEALAGFPQARRAYSVLETQDGDPIPALLTLLAEVDDTNLLHRGGPEGLRFVQKQAGDILAGPREAYISRLEALDDACIARNLSPGGCADLLALALLLYRTADIWRHGTKTDH